jgi:hypothetical protein
MTDIRPPEQTRKRSKNNYAQIDAGNNPAGDNLPPSSLPTRVSEP